MKILIVGGSADAVFLINILKQLGYRVICCDIDENCIARQIADEFHRISTFDLKKLISLVDMCDIKYVFSRSSGIAAINCYKLNQLIKANNYSEIPLELSNKLLLSDFCAKMDFPYPKTQIADYNNLIKKHKDKLVLKPILELVGKQTTYVLQNSDSIDYRLKLLSNCEANSHIRQAILQEYIDGKDITLLGFVYNRKYICYSQFLEDNEFEAAQLAHNGFFKSESIHYEALSIASKIAEQIDIPLTPLNLGFRCNGEKVHLLECNIDFGGEGVLENLYENDREAVMKFFGSIDGVLTYD